MCAGALDRVTQLRPARLGRCDRGFERSSGNLAKAGAIAEVPACQNNQEAGSGKGDKTDAQPKVLPKAA
jgi:hypothetical protein